MFLVEELLSMEVSMGVPVNGVPLTMVLVEEPLSMGVSEGVPIDRLLVITGTGVDDTPY